MKYLIIIFCLLNAVFCTPTQDISIDKLNGKYKWSAIYDVGESLEINQDSTFTYNYFQGLAFGSSNGIISKKGGYYLLKSEKQPDSSEYFIEYTKEVLESKYEILVCDTQGLALFTATCISFNKGEFVEGTLANEQGICSMDSIMVDSISIQFLGYKSANLKLRQSKPLRNMVIKLKEDDYYYYFTDQIITIVNKNKLKLNTFGRNKIFRRIKDDP